MMRKALISGLALAVTATVTAGERTRTATTRDGSDRNVAQETAVAATPHSARMIAPGVGQAEVNGTTMTARADGFINIDEVRKNYGSVGRYLGNGHTSRIRSARSQSGDTIFADGSIGHFRDLSPTQVEAEAADMDVETYKQRMAWSSTVVEGVEVTVFANGMIAAEDGYNFSKPQWVSRREKIPFSRSGNDTIYADGYISRTEQHR